MAYYDFFPKVSVFERERRRPASARHGPAPREHAAARAFYSKLLDSSAFSSFA